MHYSQASTPTAISNPPGNTTQIFKLRTQLIMASSGTNAPSALLSSNSLLSLRIAVYLERKLGCSKAWEGR